MLLRPTFLKTQRDAGTHDEGGQQARLLFELLEGVHDGVEQLLHVGGAQVAQLAVLGPAPDPLVGVGVRVVAREVLDHHLGCLASQARTALALLWMLLRSQTTVHSPGSLPVRYPRSWTTSSPCTLWSA